MYCFALGLVALANDGEGSEGEGERETEREGGEREAEREGGESESEDLLVETESDSDQSNQETVQHVPSNTPPDTGLLLTYLILHPVIIKYYSSSCQNPLKV